MKPRVEDDDLRAEYDFDFAKGEIGRYYTRLLKEGSNIVVLEPNIAEARLIPQQLIRLGRGKKRASS